MENQKDVQGKRQEKQEKPVRVPFAKTILSSGVDVAERSDSFFSSIQRNLQKEIIDKLETEKDQLTDKLFSLKDFTLQTDLNRGQSSITREEAQQRFTQTLEIEYQLEMLNMELKVKKRLFTKYFG